MISIVIPVFNSGAAMLRDCYDALGPALAAMSEPAEIIFVDDGSRDDTLETLKVIQRADKRVRVLELAANFGQHAALSAGFDAVRGDVVVTMDVDLQADPADIPRMIAPLRQGYDLVSGVRTDRRDPFMRRLASRLVTSLVAFMTGVRLRDVGCPFNAFTGEVAKSLSTFGELRRFLKPLAVRVARRVTEVDVVHRPRARRTSYSSTGLMRLFMDFFVNSVTDVFAWVFCGAAMISVLGALGFVIAMERWLQGAVAVGALLFTIAFTLAAALVALLGLDGD